MRIGSCASSRRSSTTFPPRSTRATGVSRPIVEGVENLATENVLALLNLAASCLGPDEAYVEVGVYHGASLIAALLGNEDARVIGIDSFGFRDASLEKVEQNLERFGVPRPEILVGDVFELVPSGALDGTPVGVWYYDAAHDYESQSRGCGSPSRCSLRVR